MTLVHLFSVSEITAIGAVNSKFFKKLDTD